MDQTQRQNSGYGSPEQEAVAPESPMEKLDETPAVPVPGVENPNSKEIKNEKGPNTE